MNFDLPLDLINLPLHVDVKTHVVRTCGHVVKQSNKGVSSEAPLKPIW